MSHINPAVRASVTDLDQAIQHCVRQRLHLPALILIYSGIDSMAWLDRPEDKSTATRHDFMRWVDEFLLPDSSLHCSSWDLYAARCAILHSMTPESSLSDKREARWIWYAWGNRKAGELQYAIDKMAEVNAVAVRIEDLSEGLRQATDKYFECVLQAPDRLERLNRRGEKHFSKLGFGQ